MTTCFYHGVDHDGHCSGALVKIKYPDVKLHSINYSLKEEQKYLEEKTRNEDTVIICDFSFSVAGMKYLSERFGEKLIWLDHHKSAIENIKEADLKIHGIRDNAFAACELTWRYFYNGEMPAVVKYLGRYDVWDHSDPKALVFHYGLSQYDTDPLKDMSIWNALLPVTKNGIIHSFKENLIYQILKEGYPIERYVNQSNVYQCKHAFYAIFKGFEYRIVGLLGVKGSLSFKPIWDPKKFDAMLAADFDGSSWCCSLYSDKEDIDVSVICKAHGGGGHKGASGFYTTDLFSLLEFKGSANKI